MEPMDEDLASKSSKTYRLPWTARAGRWWRGKREILGLVLVSGLSLIAFFAGNAALGGALALLGLLYMVYAYTNWFNGLN